VSGLQEGSRFSRIHGGVIKKEFGHI
jgi:hypothetical protein